MEKLVDKIVSAYVGSIGEVKDEMEFWSDIIWDLREEGHLIDDDMEIDLSVKVRERLAQLQQSL